MIVQAVKCDVCGKLKGETNHWLKVSPSVSRLDGGLMFSKDPDFQSGGLTQIEDICGQECAHKRLSAWLESLNSNTERQAK